MVRLTSDPERCDLFSKGTERDFVKATFFRRETNLFKIDNQFFIQVRH